MLNKNKILHISHTDIRYDSRILKELKVLEGLRDSMVMAYGIDGENYNVYKAQSTSYIKSVKIYTKKLNFLPKSIRHSLNFLESVFKLTIPAFRYKPTVVHCHDTLFLPIALIIKILCRSKLVYDAHELESNKNGQSKTASKITLFVEKMAWCHIDLLVTVSPSITEWYNENIGYKQNVLILNSPVLAANNDSVKSDYLRKKFYISEDKKIFLYLGYITKGRGINLYLDVFQDKNIDAHIVFMGYGNYVEEVEKIAAIYPNIHYHPAVPHDQVVEISKSADVGLCMVEAISLSDYHCLPNKLFEYAFSGLFVLCSDFPDMRKVAEEYSLGITSEVTVEAILIAVKKIETLDLKNHNSHDLYPLSWDYQAEQLVKEYHKLLKN